ncbi:MAG: hypothetical protein SGI74_00800 [Oligoflexia bacterium]|nr:hypothetical protein [Oligoflexia bacterium]
MPNSFLNFCIPGGKSMGVYKLLTIILLFFTSTSSFAFRIDSKLLHQPQQSRNETANQALTQLSQDYWDALMAYAPMWSTFEGETKYNDRLEDLSSEATTAWRSTLIGFQKRLNTINFRALTFGLPTLSHTFH